MTDNEKIQQWKIGFVCKNTPDYLNDDVAAMSLLDTLVEKKYDIFMDSTSAVFSCEIYPNNDDTRLACSYGNPTIKAAVCAAVLELIEKEDV